MSDSPAGVCWHPPEINPDFPLGAYTDDEGNLLVRVNAAPDHPQHDGCWYEPHEGKPGDYRPARDAEAGEDGHLDLVAATEDYLDRQVPHNRAEIARVNDELDELESDARAKLDGEALAARLAEIERARP